jgi:hypothetical protein
MLSTPDRIGERFQEKSANSGRQPDRSSGNYRAGL